MQLANNKNIEKLAGNINVQKTVNKIFDQNICKFLNIFSEEILKNKKAKKYVDLVTFAFWIRGKNLDKIKTRYINGEIRLGHGLAFHITPANIALNFAYSFVFSLLAGNSNIVRVTNTKFEQNEIFFKILEKILNIKKFKFIKNSNLFIRYNYDDNITKLISSNCDCRVIWGSDKTVEKIKEFSIQTTCKELIFPDRYSMSLINLNNFSKMKSKDYLDLAKKFYLDALLFDQNACSSPHLIIWCGKKNEKFYNKFWDNLNIAVKEGKYFIPNEKNKFDKYNKLCEFAAKRKEIKKSINGSYISRMILKKIPKDIDIFRVGFGYFFEYFVKDLKKIKTSISPKIQTLTYYGFKESDLRNFVYRERPNGIDRIVPVGRALEFGELWDGYDLIRNLSKIIDLK